jgi:glycerophosphoryl diester phosphodiesterase
VRILDRYDLDERKSPVFIQSFEQSNLKRLNRMTRVRLVQLVDAYDVNANGVLFYLPPFDRPYDWTVSGDPELESRTFGFFATDEGLEEVRPTPTASDRGRSTSSARTRTTTRCRPRT